MNLVGWNDITFKVIYIVFEYDQNPFLKSSASPSHLTCSCLSSCHVLGQEAHSFPHPLSEPGTVLDVVLNISEPERPVPVLESVTEASEVAGH